jgi:hypothetical protein
MREIVGVPSDMNTLDTVLTFEMVPEPIIFAWPLLMRLQVDGRPASEPLDAIPHPAWRPTHGGTCAGAIAVPPRCLAPSQSLGVDILD